MNTMQVIGKAQEMIGKLLNDHRDDIHKAYLKCEGGLSVSISLKVEPTKDPHQVSLGVGINFVESRIRDGGRVLINDMQDELFKAVEKLRPKEGDSIDSVTISSPGHESVTLKKKVKEG